MFPLEQACFETDLRVEAKKTVSKWLAAGQNVTSGDKFRDNKKAPVNHL
jgi:hypothetical protein